MSNPSLPQDDPKRRDQRAAELVWARSQYGWTHSHTYPNGQVLEPLAMLEVDDQHPLPSSQHFNLVQSIDLLTCGLELIANFIINLTNLLDVVRSNSTSRLRQRTSSARGCSASCAGTSMARSTRSST